MQPYNISRVSFVDAGQVLGRARQKTHNILLWQYKNTCFVVAYIYEKINVSLYDILMPYVTRRTPLKTMFYHAKCTPFQVGE